MKLRLSYGISAVTLTCAAAIGGTQAYNVGDYVAGAYVQAGSRNDTQSTAVHNSSAVTERRVITVTAESQNNMVLGEIASRLHGSAPVGSTAPLLPKTGANAGSRSNPNSVYVHAGFDNLHETIDLGHWDANLYNLALGYDYRINDKILTGVALSYSYLKGNTKFNYGHISDNAYGIVPYIAIILAPCFDLDAIFGYSRVEKSRDRRTPSASAPTAILTGPVATSSPNSNRYFASLYANFKKEIDKWNLLARLGYMYTLDNQGAFNESSVGQANSSYSSIHTRLNRLSLRLQAGYKVTNCVEPYGFLTYARDFSFSRIVGVQEAPGTFGITAAIPGITFVGPNAKRGNNTYAGGLGVNTGFSQSFSGALEASYVYANKFRNVGGWARLRWVF